MTNNKCHHDDCLRDGPRGVCIPTPDKLAEAREMPDLYSMTNRELLTYWENKAKENLLGYIDITGQWLINLLLSRDLVSRAEQKEKYAQIVEKIEVNSGDWAMMFIKGRESMRREVFDKLFNS